MGSRGVVMTPRDPGKSDYVDRHSLRFPGGNRPGESPLLFPGCFSRHTHGCASRDRAGRRDGDTSSHQPADHAGRVDYHAGWDLLRSHVRRIDHIDPGLHSGRAVKRDDLRGRSPDGLEGQGGIGIGNRRLRQLHRGDVQCRLVDVSCRSSRNGCIEIRTSGILFPCAHGADDGHVPVPEISPKSPHVRADRDASFLGGDRSGQWNLPFHLRAARTQRRYRRDTALDGTLRDIRGFYSNSKKAT